MFLYDSFYHEISTEQKAIRVFHHFPNPRTLVGERSSFSGPPQCFPRGIFVQFGPWPSWLLIPYDFL